MRKAKKPKHRMPKLSLLDEIIYWVIFGILCLLYFDLAFFSLMLRQKIAFSDETVIAATENASSFWLLVPMLTVLMTFFILWLLPYQDRRPIFGLKNFKYGPPAWPRVYPLFMKNKPYVWISERKKKERKQIAIALAILLLVSFIPYPWSLYGRDCLYADGSIRQYSMFNNLQQEYVSGEIESAEFSVYHYSTGRYGTGTRWGVQVSLTADNGRTYVFEDRDFRSDGLQAMATLRQRFDPSILTAENPEEVEHYISDRQPSEEEMQLLHQLFGREPPH